MADAQVMSIRPKKNRRQVSPFLSNGWVRPPHAPAHRQQQKHKPMIGMKIVMRATSKITSIKAQYFLSKSPHS